jgi:hypothetical protein
MFTGEEGGLRRSMDAVLETLIVFYDGLWRRAKSKTVTMLRRLAVGCIIGGAASFIIATFAAEAFQNGWLVAGTMFGSMFLILMLWCVALVWLERKNQ